jgi:LPXTG-motif cell wall-anchored protein
VKISNFYKFVGAGAIAASLAVVPLTLPAQAQNTAPGNTQRDANVDRTGPIDAHTEREDNNDLGWFGLLGLAGLAGLAGRKRTETTHHASNDPNVRVH